MKKSELLKTLEMSSQDFNYLIDNGIPSIDDNYQEFDLEKVVEFRNNLNQDKINNLKIGEEYKGEDVADAFKCSLQKGLNRSHRTNSLVIVSRNIKREDIYDNKWEGDIFYYTGEGREGDQDIEKGQNRVLKNYKSNYVNLYLFESFKAGHYIYAGPVELSEKIEPFYILERDVDKEARSVIKFPIVLKNKAYAPPLETIENNKEERSRKNKKEKNIEDLLKKAKDASELNKEESNKIGSSKPFHRQVRINYYDRSKEIRDIVKYLANGRCTLCEEKAPFNVDNVPFLHVHHIEYLAKGGSDTIDNCVAVCPNCHAKIHMLEDPIDKEKLIESVNKRPQKYRTEI